MKKTKKLLAVILSAVIVFSIAIPSVVAEDNDTATTTQSISEYFKSEEYYLKRGVYLSKFLNKLVNDVILEGLSRMIPNLSFVRDDTQEAELDNFYEGNEFISTDSGKYIWNVGYSSKSILPDDFGTPLKYARGSYAPWGYSTDVYTDDDGNKETMKVRTVILDDNTGRGLTVFCVVDCIGISNTDVRNIRAALADFAEENNVVSLNVSAIHSHMAIDSQGVWNSPITTVLNNMLSSIGLTNTKFGVNSDYLDTIINQTKASVEEAYKDMKPGKLTYTDIELSGYCGTRTVSSKCDSNIHKIAFYPTDTNCKSTIIASFGAHPEVTSYGAEFDSKLSSDFVYYMEKLVNKAGSNFIYIQGNVGTNSCGRSNSEDGLDLADNHESAMRYGYEMAYITLGASMNYDERVLLNKELGDKLGVETYSQQDGYTVWYDGLATYEEEDVDAVLNVKHSQVKLEVDNSVSKILLKLGLASNDLAYNKETGKYYTITEVGYMELGDAVKVFFSPGELYSELYVGGYGLEDSSLKSLRETYGDDVILFDLMNDAAGYICPDETYSILDARYYPGSSGEININTWCMVVSIGEHTASTIMNAYKDLVG